MQKTNLKRWGKIYKNMGMYTELIFGASFKKDTPTDVIDTLRYMAGDLQDEPSNYLWTGVRNPLQGGSYSFGVCASVTSMWYDAIRGWVLSSRSSIKNYDSDIDLFIEFVKPYISEGSGSNDMYAIVMYEEFEQPTIYYLEP